MLHVSLSEKIRRGLIRCWLRATIKDAILATNKHWLMQVRFFLSNVPRE